MPKTSESKNETSPKSLINKYKRPICIVGSVICITALAAIGVKYYRDATAFERWFKNASLPELKAKREIIHSEYLAHTTNDDYRKSLWDLLPRFDRRISEIEWAGKTPTGPSYSREDGYNLYRPNH